MSSKLQNCHVIVLKAHFLDTEPTYIYGHLREDMLNELEEKTRNKTATHNVVEQLMEEYNYHLYTIMLPLYVVINILYGYHLRVSNASCIYAQRTEASEVCYTMLHKNFIKTGLKPLPTKVKKQIMQQQLGGDSPLTNSFMIRVIQKAYMTLMMAFAIIKPEGPIKKIPLP